MALHYSIWFFLLQSLLGRCEWTWPGQGIFMDLFHISFKFPVLNHYILSKIDKTKMVLFNCMYLALHYSMRFFNPKFYSRFTSCENWQNSTRKIRSSNKNRRKTFVKLEWDKCMVCINIYIDPCVILLILHVVVFCTNLKECDSIKCIPGVVPYLPKVTK